MPDPLVTGGALALAGSLISKIDGKQVGDFIAAVSGHPGESVGTMLGNIARRRITNAESVTEKAHFILLNIGVKAQTLPTNVLHSILDGASLQDDEWFQTRWACLLANAADSRNRHPFETCFAAILRNLSGREVKFLDGLFHDKRQFALNERRFHDIYRDAGLARNPAPPHMPTYSTKPVLDDLDTAEFDLMMDIIDREGILSANAEGKSGTSRFARLGLAFVQACQKPQADAGALGA